MNEDTLRRIAEALERLAPPPRPAPDLSAAQAYVWQPDPDQLVPVAKVNRVDPRDAREQRAFVGRARYGEIQPCESDPCGRATGPS